MTDTTSPTPSEALALAVRALEAMISDIEDYERVNNLAPNPGKADCWQSVAQARAALQSLRQISQPDSGWRPTHRHIKRGTEYEVIGRALLQTEVDVGDMSALVVYRAKDGQIWARPPHEFNDGRFEAVPAAPLDLAADDEPRPVEPAGKITVGAEHDRLHGTFDGGLVFPAPNPHAELIEALKHADEIVDTLARARRPHGYVLTTVLPLDKELEAYLQARGDDFSPAARAAERLGEG